MLTNEKFNYEIVLCLVSVTLNFIRNFCYSRYLHSYPFGLYVGKSQHATAATDESLRILYSKTGKTSRMSSGYPRNFKTSNLNRECVNRNPAGFTIPASNKNHLGNCVSCDSLHPRYGCPHRKSTCYNCGQIRHIQFVCKSIRPYKLVQPDNTKSSAVCH